jgi:glycosyltransferase involved in cell wall biosynthesis
VKILLDNVDPHSTSGPNSFGRKLMNELNRRGHEASTVMQDPDVQLSFIQRQATKARKTALRLDGIYFNTRQDWDTLNQPIKKAFSESDLVIYQSQFNKRLSEKYFGAAKSSIVIGNGTSKEEIDAIPVTTHPALDKFEEVWCCSSSWRPHKRLKENVRYFLENKGNKTCLIVLGDNPDYFIDREDVLFAGKQTWEACISVYKRSKKFIHLAFLDHCPNVVVDARASGCDIVVSSSGGTPEISGENSTIVRDMEWDMRPLDLYSPPALDFRNSYLNYVKSTIDIQDVTEKYISGLQSII